MAIKFGNDDLIRERHFLVTKIEKKLTKSGDEYVDLELADKEGVIAGKIWNNALPRCQFEINKVVELNGKVQEYRGAQSLIVDNCQIVNNEDPANFMPTVPTLVFDIETVGKKFEDLDQKEQDYLLNNLEKAEDNKEIAKTKTALYSIFGMVAAIGCFNPDTQKGVVLAISDKELMPEDASFEYKIFKNEAELLQEFWKLAKNYEKFVTYNGDSFDFPYLIIRSGINRVKVSIEKGKYNDNFIDLQNKIRQNHGFKLEMLCKAFLIENPKGQGVDGSEVTNLYYRGELNRIADYVARDAKATSSLYLLWKEFMSGQII
jgi:DNA polymerase elongation subunit (family B)